jgi:hypothetical protein
VTRPGPLEIATVTSDRYRPLPSSRTRRNCAPPVRTLVDDAAIKGWLQLGPIVIDPAWASRRWRITTTVIAA